MRKISSFKLIFFSRNHKKNLVPELFFRSFLFPFNY